jgi:hypothetical protein
MNICGNPLWTTGGNWKDRYYFANKDVLKSEKLFMRLSGCPNVIPAGTNVSNAMVIFLTQSIDKSRLNYFGYDKLLLIGFDYSWNDNYYSFDKEAGGKRNYMRHITVYNANNKLAYTSTNLAFSCDWLTKYISIYQLPVVQCSKETILITEKMGDLKKELQYNYNQQDKDIIIESRIKINQLKRMLNEEREKLKTILRDHQYNYLI